MRPRIARKLALVLVAACVLAPSSGRAQEPQPGDACSTAGNTTRSGGPEIPGGHLLVCDGTNWVSFMDYRDSGQILFQVDNDTGSCTTAKDGRIRYNSSASPPYEYCDGGATTWRPFEQPQCQDDDTGECFLEATRSNDDPDFAATNIADGVNILGVTGTVAADGGCGGAPALCPNIGDVCDDGNAGNDPDPLFAGYMVYQDLETCQPLFVTNANQSISAQWKTSTGGNDVNPQSDDDGQLNDSSISNSNQFPAFKLCKDLTDGGFTDWYLPARDELYLLWANQFAIDANDADTWETNNYWSSTEAGAQSIVTMHWGSGNIDNINKDLFRNVRCVRRD